MLLLCKLTVHGMHRLKISRYFILKKYFENTILFYILKILYWSILFCYFENTLFAVFYFVFSKYFSKVFCTSLPAAKQKVKLQVVINSSKTRSTARFKHTARKGLRMNEKEDRSSG